MSAKFSRNESNSVKLTQDQQALFIFIALCMFFSYHNVIYFYGVVSIIAITYNAF